MVDDEEQTERDVADSQLLAARRDLSREQTLVH